MDTADARAAASSSPAPAWERLSWDLAEFILARLPLLSIVRAGAVCKQWRAVVCHPSFPTRAASARRRPPWFFLHGQNNVVLRLNRAFGYDPDAGEWVDFALPSSGSVAADCFSGAGGFAFAATSPSRFGYAPVLRGAWRETRPLAFSRCNPLIAVFYSRGAAARPRFLVVGGARFIGGLVDIEERLAAEIYDPVADAWEQCPPLPPEFRSGNSSSQWLSSALVAGRDRFFVSGIFSGTVSAFDLGRREWTGVRSLRPPGVLFAFLASCGDRLILAGLCTAAEAAAAPCFAVWAVDPNTMAYDKIGEMPRELLGCLFDTDDDDKFASLKCVGLDGLVYVFNEDHHKAYPACVCEIAGDGGNGILRCTWRKVPPLPGVMSRFHKMVAFCSPVLMDTVLVPGAGDPGAMH